MVFLMGMVMTTVRLEKGVKEKFDSLCKDFGMSVNTAFTLFVNKVIEEGSIPFPIGGGNLSSKTDVGVLDRLSGAWADGRSTEDVVKSLRESRTFGRTRKQIDY